MCAMMIVSLSAQNNLVSKSGKNELRERSMASLTRANGNVDLSKIQTRAKLISPKIADKRVKPKSVHREQATVFEQAKNVESNTLKSTNVIVWSNDFSNSSAWVIGNLASNTQNWIVTTNAPTGFYSSTMGAINSTTALNGFALYDSDAIGTAANSMGDQNAYIQTSSSINLSGHPYVKIKFQQLYRKYNCQTYVGVKVGTNSWVDIEVNSNVMVNDFGDDIVEVDISSIAGNASNVKIRFLYYGEWDYAWMVDDVSIEDAFVNDVEAQFAFTLGKLPLGNGHAVSALVKNVGASAVSNVAVSLNISGANLFSDSYLISSLASGDDEEVIFSTYTPTVAGNNTVTVSVSADNNNTNNSYSYYHETGNVFAYSDTSGFSGALGYADGSGLILCKYDAGPLQAVTHVNAFIAESSDVVGQTVYGAVLNELGSIVALSNNYVITAADTGQWVTFQLNTQPSFTNEVFYVGLAQTANTITPYYPLGTQTEPYIRNNAYYIGGLTGGTLTEANTYGRFMIEAVMGTGNSYDCAVTDIVSPANSASCVLTNSETVTVTVENLGLLSLSNIPVSYSINGGTAVTEIISSTILPGSSVNHTFTTLVNLSTVGLYELTAYTDLTIDEDTQNDAMSVYVTHGNASINVEILTDDYGYETFWGLFNDAGDLIYVDGNYSNNTLYSIDLCVLSTECYTFLIIDDYGDGIYTPGYYEVSYNNVVVGGNSSFGTAEEYIYNIGAGCPANDLGVDMVYTLGEIPILQGSPHVVSALIYNYGTATQNNVSVSLGVSGANIFNNSQTINSLQPGDEVEVFFTAFTPLVLGTNNVEVSIPNDENNLNNSFSYIQEVNSTVFSYTDTSNASPGIGYDTGEGLLFNRHYMNGSADVSQVAIRISSDTETAGNTIYAVVLDSDTNVVAQSANYIVLAADIDTWLSLDLTLSASFTDEEFYIGMAQTANTTTGYFPLGTQDEPFARENCFFGSALDGSGSVAYTNLGRFALKAVLTHAPSWTYTNTGAYHNIMVSNLIDISIDGVPIESGDYLGLFYDNGGVLECAGYSLYNGNTFAITAWGAQTGQNDGFLAGEAFKWKIWDATDGTEYEAIASYNTVTFPNDGYYSTGGLSGLQSLIATSASTHSVLLNQGWGIYSSYVAAFELNIDSIFSSIASNIIIAKDGWGMIYWPMYGVNGIGNWVVEEGYQINSVIQQSLDITGTGVNPANSPISLPSGWSIMGYLRTSPGNAVTMMSTIVSNIIIMKDGNGFVYWPQWGLNAIGDMLPGQGYQINLTAAQIFTFPANSGQISKTISPAKPVIPSTGKNATYGFPDNSFKQQIKAGDKIRIYNNRGLLVGETLVDRNITAVTAWGNDETSMAIDGLSPNESPVFKLADGNSGEEFLIQVSVWLEGDGFYADDKINVAKSVELHYRHTLMQNHPNPATDFTVIGFSINESAPVQIVIMNLLGEIIQTPINKTFPKGSHALEINTQSLASGTYFYRMISADFEETKMMEVK